MTEVRQKRAMMALVGVIVISALYLVHGLVPAIAWAAVMAVGLEPLRARLVRRFPGHESLVAGGISVLVAAVVVIPLAIALAQAASETSQIAAWLQRARIHGIPVPQWVGSVPIGADHITGWWNAHLAEPGAAARELSRLDMASIAKRSQSIGSHVVARLVTFGFIVTTLFFLLRDRDFVVGQLRAAAERAFGPDGPRIGSHAMSSVRGTIDGIVLVGLAQGLVMGLVYALCGVPHPVLLGLLTAIGAMIPFGLVIALAIPLLLLAAKGAFVALAVVLALGLASNFVADHFVRPALIGGATKMPFLWVLLGLIGGIETIGLLGLFVGPAVMAVLALLWREYVDGGPQIKEPATNPHDRPQT